MLNSTKHSRNIAGGVILIGIGVLLMTGWWWPGIMLVIGSALAADLAIRGETRNAAAVFLVFLGIPLLISLLSTPWIPWAFLGPIILIGLGLFLMFKSLRRN